MKLLLISLQSNAYVTGLKYIAAKAKAKGHDVKILFLPGYLEKELHPEIKRFISDHAPDLIGISLMSIEFYPAKNITLQLKNVFNIPIIWGGVHAIIQPDDCIQYADYVCTGEGEKAIAKLLQHIRDREGEVPPDIPGIWTNHKGKIIKRSNAEPVGNLDALPHQEYLPEYFYGLHQNRIYNFRKNEKLFRTYALYGGTCHMLISTRGCPYRCSYCGNSAFISVYGRKVRERSVDNVIEEMMEVKRNPFVLYMNFQDDCFFAHNLDWVREFSDKYKKCIGLPFIVRVIPSMMDREKLKLLKEAGLSWIVMGIQSGSDRVNFEVYDRNIRFTSVKEAADVIAANKAAPFYEMIVDNPYETDEERMETITKMSQLPKPYIISLAHLTYFPGTPLAEKSVKGGIAKPDDYLYRYLLKVDDLYFNRLLGITPALPRKMVEYLNKNEDARTGLQDVLLGLLYPVCKRLIEPLVFLFITARSLNYRMDWIMRTVIGNWKPAMARLVSKYLGKSDLEFDQRLTKARNDMPELFQG